MLKLKFFFAFFLVQSAVFAWGQQPQPSTLTAPTAKAGTEGVLPADKGTTGRAHSVRKKDEMGAGRKNAEGLICSVFGSGFDWLSLSFVLTSYTTFHVDASCNEDAYTVLTLASIQAQTEIPSGAKKIFRGGAHAYTMDVNLSTVRDPYFYIGSLRFAKTGEVRISILDAIKKKTDNIAGLINAPYTTYNFKSQVHYIWNIGTLIHRLVAPNGDAYIMYSWTSEVSTGLTRENLMNLKDRLSLPPGWKFENLLVSQTITVRPAPIDDYTSAVLYDELNNFYVKYQP